jgi:tRNA (cmo5U34)-methyltransferase
MPIEKDLKPGERWAFDGDVTANFDDMLARSIPQYEVMRDLVFDVASSFAAPKTDIVDLGCSRGEAMARLIDRFGAHNRFVGVEVSPPMLEVARSRFKGLIEMGIVDIRDDDLRVKYPPVRASVTLSVLTLQFIPIEHRMRLLSDAAAKTIPGGALILVEKILGESVLTDGLFVSRYHRMKKEHGYSQDEIDRKRLSLEGVLVPMTAGWNQEILRAAGFTKVECFWRWMNFAAWVAVK